jgi:two-component system, LytTR family, sensor kinase
MSNVLKSKKLSALIHILGWSLIALFLFLLTPLSWKVDLPFMFWLKQGLVLSSLIAIFYINSHLLVPNFLFKGKTLKFIITLVIIGFLYLMILFLFDQITNLPELMFKSFRPGATYKPRPRGLTNELFSLMIYFLAIGISTSISAVRKWQMDENLRIESEQQRINSELNYLKAQINPHFFFNTLNNIYALTNIDVDRAKTAILKLSRMMRYVLYETEKDQTVVTKEVDFIVDFMELMKLRLPENVKLTLHIPEKIEENTIAPMMLLPFIENCFKHGISSQKESIISISIETEKNSLTLKTCNSKFLGNPNSPEGKITGIGLNNTKRRLSLMYENKHELKIDEQNPENEFRVYLKILLT